MNIIDSSRILPERPAPSSSALWCAVSDSPIRGWCYVSFRRGRVSSSGPLSIRVENALDRRRPCSSSPLPVDSCRFLYFHPNRAVATNRCATQTRTTGSLYSLGGRAADPAFGYLRAPLLACIMEIDFSGRLESRRGRLSA